MQRILAIKIGVGETRVIGGDAVTPALTAVTGAGS